jgi:hypothetical protein
MRSSGDWNNVQVLGIGHLAAAVRLQLRAALDAHEAGFENDSSESLLLACSDFPNTASFRDANTRTLASGGRIVFAALTPAVLRLGPVVEPGRAGCFECVAARLHPLAKGPVRSARAAGGEADPIRDAWIGASLIVQVILGSGPTPYRGTSGRGISGHPRGSTERRTGAAGCPACMVDRQIAPAAPLRAEALLPAVKVRP